MELGRLEAFELRQAWPDEALDFTPWLAKPENLELLGDTLGMELELESVEKRVGQFRADILCKDMVTDNWVLVENQLETTDHKHLGQLLTYAAALDATTIVWIARNFTEDHRAALDWLNEVTTERARFFGLGLELWRIGNSSPAPKFNVYSKPNDWSRAATQDKATTGEISKTNQLYLEYWESVRDRIEAEAPMLRPGKPPSRNWYPQSIGRTRFRVDARLNSIKNHVYVALILSGQEAKPAYYQFEEERDAIEQEYGEPLEWYEAPEAADSWICSPILECDPLEKENWEAMRAFHIDHMERMERVFRRRVQELPRDVPAEEESE